METRNGFHYCYGNKEWFSLQLCRRGIDFITAMEKRNGFHYCYGDEEWFSLLLWRRGMVFTIAMEKRNGFHYCYGDKEWIQYWYGAKERTLLMLTNPGMG